LIKAVVFDLGGVYFTNGTSIAIKKFEDMLGIPTERLLEVFGEERGLGRDYRLGNVERKEFWSKVAETLDVDSETVKAMESIGHSS